MHLNPKILHDPQFNLSGMDRYKLMRRASRQWVKKPLNISLYMFVLVAWFMFMINAPYWIDSLVSNNATADMISWFVVQPLTLIVLFYLYFHCILMKYVYQELRDLGHDICLSCGYTLIDLSDSESKCPECGTPRTKPIGCPYSPSSAQ